MFGTFFQIYYSLKFKELFRIADVPIMTVMIESSNYFMKLWLVVGNSCISCGLLSADLYRK